MKRLFNFLNIKKKQRHTRPDSYTCEIKVKLSDCIIMPFTGNVSHEDGRALDVQMLDGLIGKSESRNIAVEASYLIYEQRDGDRVNKFVSPVIAKDKATLAFLVSGEIVLSIILTRPIRRHTVGTYKRFFSMMGKIASIALIIFLAYLLFKITVADYFVRTSGTCVKGLVINEKIRTRYHSASLKYEFYVNGKSYKGNSNIKEPGAVGDTICVIYWPVLPMFHRAVRYFDWKTVCNCE